MATSLASNAAVSCTAMKCIIHLIDHKFDSDVIAQKAQECIQKCQFDKSGDPECQQDCAKEYLPEGQGRGLQQMGGAYGNNFPQGGYQGQSYSQGGYGQTYGTCLVSLSVCLV